jgi:hypothetical protein
MTANVIALDKATKLVQKTAKAKIGEYQPQAGPFAAWDPLSPATLYGFMHPAGFYIPGKVQLGYAPPDNPLLRTGEMRATIERKFDNREGHVGSDDQVMVWQELGTRFMPPRSVLGGAAVETSDRVAVIIGDEIAVSLGAESVLGSSRIAIA